MRNARKWLAWAGLILALTAGTARAALEAGSNYKLLPSPQATESGAKIEVVEFFWYGCPHCYDLDPVLNKWVARLPKDVEFRRVPAIPTERWAPAARIFYTLEALGELERLHGPVFDAFQRDHVNLGDEKTLFDWMAKHGVDRKKFSDTWSSFTVQSKVRRAAQITQAFGIDGVPTLAVEGKYETSVSMTGGPEQLTKTLDELIAKARGERKK